MPRVTVETTKAEIEYDTIGDPGDPALLLIMGFTGQLITWRKEFCQLLADGGRYVIRYDNRDCGLSTHYDGQQVDLMALMQAVMAGGGTIDAPYNLSDMAADAVGLLDALGIDTAHVVGASMGGMIAQVMAIDHPTRVGTLTSIMSTTGEADYGQPTPEAMQTLLTPPAPEREAYIERGITLGRVISSPRYFDPERTRTWAAESFDRCFYPEGAPRQLAAVVASGPRTDTLPQLQVPTLVIHGRADPLVTLSGGERTAALIPGANLLVLGDMGHDLPVPLWPLITDAILSHTKHAVGNIG